ncbi:MAG: hypothetical protein V1806_03805 [Pseudomonadota bacterium]
MPSRSYRNNNPGNLRASKWTRGRSGYIGDDMEGQPARQPGMARFATWWDGVKAMGDLLHLSSYQALDVRGLIYRYAPPADKNDSARYVTQVCLRAGCQPEDRVATMTPVQFLAMVEAMITHEGWIPPA